MELALSAAQEDESSWWFLMPIYGAIKPKHVATLLQRTDVHAHLILIGSTGDEAPHLETYQTEELKCAQMVTNFLAHQEHTLVYSKISGP
jgi:hypothetical protein